MGRVENTEHNTMWKFLEQYEYFVECISRINSEGDREGSQDIRDGCVGRGGTEFWHTVAIAKARDANASACSPWALI